MMIGILLSDANKRVHLRTYKNPLPLVMLSKSVEAKLLIFPIILLAFELVSVVFFSASVADMPPAFPVTLFESSPDWLEASKVDPPSLSG